LRRKDSRIKYNVITSLMYQLVLIGISFVLPRLYIDTFGSEVNGVLSTIKQIFAYMCLLEAGIGLATTQALYKHIGKKDYESISSIMAATHSYYVKTGIAYVIAVLVIGVVYAYIIPSEMNSHEIFVIVLLHAVPSLFGFFVQEKYKILMQVDGRKYVINGSETVMHIVSNGAKLLVLLLTGNIILIQLSYCLIALAQLVFLYVYAKRRYKWLNMNAKPDFEAVSQKNSVMVHQISGMVFTSTDLILISKIRGYKVASVYNIYNFFFSTMQTFITSVSSGFSFALGQLFNTDKSRFDKVFTAYEAVYIMITYIIYTLMAVFLLPLIQIYTKGITDANYSNAYLVFLFVIMNLLSNGKLPVNSLLEYSGRFEETRSHAVWEMVINLSVSVTAIMVFGICGAIMGTIVALVYRSIVMIHFGNRKILGRSVMFTYKCWIINGAVFALVMAVFFVDSFSGLSFGKLVIRGIIHSVWIVGAYVGANLLFQRNVCKTLMELYREKKKL